MFKNNKMLENLIEKLFDILKRSGSVFLNKKKSMYI